MPNLIIKSGKIPFSVKLINELFNFFSIIYIALLRLLYVEIGKIFIQFYEQINAELTPIFNMIKFYYIIGLYAFYLNK